MGDHRFTHYEGYRNPTKEQVAASRQRMLDGIAEQNAARELERERSRISAAAYEARWEEYYKSLNLDDVIETPGVVTFHKEGRRVEVLHRQRLVNGRYEIFETVDVATGELIT